MTAAIDYTSTGEIATYVPSLASDPSTVTPTVLGLIITRVSRQIDDITRRRFYTSTGDETVYVNGNGKARLYDLPYDIVSVTTLALAADTVKATSGTYTTISTGDYYLQPSYPSNGWPYQWIELSNQPSGSYSTSFAYTAFPEGYNTVKIVGKFGWSATGSSAVPDEIRHAATELVVRAWRGRDMNFSDVVGVDGLGTATFSRRIPADIQDILDRYTRQKA